MHKMIEQIHNSILSFMFGLHAHLRVFAEVYQMRHSILFYLKFYSDELMSGLTFLYLGFSELSDVLVILILTFSLDLQLIPQHKILPLSLKVLPWDVFHQGVFSELLLVDHLQEKFLSVLEELLVVDGYAFVELLLVGALRLVDVGKHFLKSQVFVASVAVSL